MKNSETKELETAESSPAAEPQLDLQFEEEPEFSAPDPESFTPEERAKWLETGQLPQREKSAISKESSEAAESEPAKEAEEKPKPEESKKERKPQTAETRINQLEAEIAALKQQKAERIQALLEERKKLSQEISQLGAKPESPPGAKPEALQRPKRPKMNDFEDYEEYESALEEYMEKLAEWKANERIEAEKKAYQQQVQRQMIEQRNTQVKKNWETRLAESRQRHPDFEQVVHSVDLPLNPVMDSYLLESEIGPEVVYALCRNVTEAERIAKLPPMACIRELVKLEASISESIKQASQPKKITAAKPPPTELSGTNRVAEDEAAAALETGDFERYMNIMNKRDAARIVR